MPKFLTIPIISITITEMIPDTINDYIKIYWHYKRDRAN